MGEFRVRLTQGLLNTNGSPQLLMSSGCSEDPCRCAEHLPRAGGEYVVELYISDKGAGGLVGCLWAPGIGNLGVVDTPARHEPSARAWAALMRCDR